MKNNKLSKKPDRNYFDLEAELDQIFAIDRIAFIESGEAEAHSCLLETYGAIVEFYQSLVGRRIAVREFLAGKNDDQAVEEELRHLRNVIGSFIERASETIDSELRFGQLVQVREQKKVWNIIFADFPGLLVFDNPFYFRLQLLFILFGCPFLVLLLSWLLPPKCRDVVISFGGIGFCLYFFVVILLQVFYFRHRSCFHSSTLRVIAEKIVESKKQFANYPISSVNDVEPLIRRTFQETFLVSFDLLKPETRLDLELGFEL
jgi:hypothetical protein